MITEQDRIAAEAAASEITHVAREARAADGEQDDLESSRIRHHENLEAQSLATLPPTEPPPLTTRQRLLAKADRGIALWEKRRKEAENLPAAFDTLQLEAEWSEYCGAVDFNFLPHDKVIEVIESVGGKWKKTPNGAKTIDYDTKIGETRIRCYMGDPPPQCKLVEVEVTIPAQPERIEKQWKMVCPRQEDATL